MKNVITALLSIFFVNVVFAQNLNVISSGNYNNPNWLVQNVFAGQGVNIQNISFYGDSNQIGYFSQGINSVQMDSGIVLSTGYATEATGNFGGIIAGPNAAGFGPAYFGNASSNALLSVSQSVPALLGLNFTSASSVNDAAVLEFDFTPESDTIEFVFSFASDEWNTYPCTQYNDVFGFFVSGPGITGTYASPAGFPGGAVNIANVPGSTPAVPITISSIHPGSNSCGSAPLNNQFYNTGNIGGMTLNGFTDTLKATIVVQACETYHLALAIGDGTDAGLTSTVFFKANSFKASGIQIHPVQEFTGIGGDSILFEGCGDVTLNLVRYENVNDTDTVNINVGGTALMGTDYTNIGNQYVFLPGMDTIPIVITVFNDGIPEGSETISIQVLDTNLSLGCGFDSNTVTFNIEDPIALTSVTTSDTIICPNETADLAVLPLTGFPDFFYQWNTGDTTESIVVDSVIHQNGWTDYTVTITDACSLFTIVDTASVYLNYTPMVAGVDSQIVLPCITSIDTAFSSFTGGEAPYQFSWNNFPSFNGGAFLLVNGSSDTVNMRVTDKCKLDTVSQNFFVSIQSYPSISLIDTAQRVPCVGDTARIPVNYSGGSGAITYQWNTGQTDSVITHVATNNDQSFVVTVTDACTGEQLVDTIVAGMFEYDDFIVAPFTNDTVWCKDLGFNFGPLDIEGGSGDYAINWNNGEGDQLEFSGPMTSNSLNFNVVVRDSCVDRSVTRYFKAIAITHDPLKGDLEYDSVVCYNEPLVLSLEAQDGAGYYSYLWSTQDTGATIEVSLTASDTIVGTISDSCGNSLSKNAYIRISTPDPSFSVSYLDIEGDEQVDISHEDSPFSGNAALDVRFSAFNQDPSMYYVWDLYTNGTPNDANKGWPIVIQDDGSYSTAYTYEIEGSYVAALSATDEYGCVDSAFAIIDVILNEETYNVFTPNGDGMNDIFILPVNGLRNYKSVVYNRWGQKIFEWNSPLDGWDGEEHPEGVYFYTLTGIKGSGEPYESSGYIQLIR